MNERQSIYPRFTCISNASPTFVKKLADYGFLDRVYPSKDLKELNCFESDFKHCVKEFAEGKNIYLRFYSISPELDERTIIPAFHLITMGYVTSAVQLKASEQQFKEPFITKKWFRYRRALGIKVI